METERTESALSPEQVDECRRMFREACGNVGDHICGMFEWLCVMAELAPVLRVDYHQAVERILADCQSRCAGRR